MPQICGLKHIHVYNSQFLLNVIDQVFYQCVSRYTVFVFQLGLG